MQDLISRLAGRHVAVVGDVMLDEWLWGKVHRISPEAPIPVVDVQRMTFTLGGAANVAANLASLGARVLLFGVVGDDEAGRRFRGELDRLVIDARGLVVDPSRPTTTKTRIVAHNQQIVRTDRESRAPLDGALISRLALGLGQVCRDGTAEAVLVSDYAKGVVTGALLAEGLELAARKGRLAELPIVVDPKGLDYLKYRGATVLTPNQQEAALAAGVAIEDEASLLRAGKRLLEIVACRAVLITRGEEGMSLFEVGGEVTHLPTMAREVYDVTGAGDTVAATLALALASGASPLEAARLANHAAGVVVAKVGTATLTHEELLRSFDHA